VSRDTGPRVPDKRTSDRRAAGGHDRRPIRVAHVVTTLAIGGLEKVVLDLARGRTQQDFEASLICLDNAGVLEREFSAAGVPVAVIGTRGSVPQRVWRLSRRLRALAPDVVHTHNPQAHLHGAWAARLAGVPAVVQTKHGRDHVARPVLAVLGRIATAWTDGFVAVSDDAAQVARDQEHVPPGKLLVVHNGIDLERFGAVLRQPALPRGRLVTVGRLDPIKDQATMLRAVKMAAGKIPALRLDIVGDGPSRQDLEALTADLGLEGRVTFLGYHADVAPLLSAADAFVLSSISEGVSIALLEAMASGLPAIATDVGGNREVIVDGVTGVLTAAGSAEAMAEAIVRLESDPGVLGRMGLASRRRVEEEFNLQRVVARYEALYRRCLAEHASKARTKG
jgi:sugar transferase (PEP-CTERM/EpsH1 system associated)